MTPREQWQSPPELRSHRSFPPFSQVGEKPRSAFKKFLSIFAAERGATTLLLTVNVFLLLASYYLLKTARADYPASWRFA